MRNPRLLETKGALNIQSLKHLSSQIGISEEEIIDIADNIKNHYRIKEIIQVKSNGSIKKRDIYLPSLRLVKILKAINKYLSLKANIGTILDVLKAQGCLLTFSEYLLEFDKKRATNLYEKVHTILFDEGKA